jgi:hypothetical protein
MLRAEMALHFDESMEAQFGSCVVRARFNRARESTDLCKVVESQTRDGNKMSKKKVGRMMHTLWKTLPWHKR